MNFDDVLYSYSLYAATILSKNYFVSESLSWTLLNGTIGGEQTGCTVMNMDGTEEMLRVLRLYHYIF
jgi:hypothetical protein